MQWLAPLQRFLSTVAIASGFENYELNFAFYFRPARKRNHFPLIVAPTRSEKKLLRFSLAEGRGQLCGAYSSNRNTIALLENVLIILWLKSDGMQMLGGESSKFNVKKISFSGN